MVVEQANLLRRLRRQSPIRDSHFFSRFLSRHPELRKAYVKPVELARKGYEVALHDVNSFFDRVEESQTKYRLVSSGVWNGDECGNMIGKLHGRLAIITIRNQLAKNPEVYDPNNRESMTLMGCGSAAGDAIPAYCIFKVWPNRNFAQAKDLHDDVAFTQSDTGFSNSDIMLDWLRHFKRYSFGYNADFKRLGVTLEEWFGIDYLFCFDWREDKDPPEMAKGRRASEGAIWRGLFLDGFAGHYSIEVVTYAHRFNILLIFLPPHSTHKLQPMDVGVFQHLKKRHQQMLQKMIREDKFTVSREDFVCEALGPMLAAAFTPGHIMYGFERTGHAWSTI
jgi:hypothetical protein